MLTPCIMEHSKHTQRFSLSGKTALITGSSRGLGWEFAKSMAEAGAHTILNGRDRQILENNVQVLSQSYLQAETIVLDASDTAAVTQWVAEQAAEVDILVNNIGPRTRRPIAELMPQDFRNMLDGGLVGAHNLARLLAPGMIERGGGCIINMTSIAGPLGKVDDSAYVATKAGLEGLTRALATELGPQGVRCNGIAPGFFQTEANAEMAVDPGVNHWVDLRVPLKRWGDPLEIAGAAVFLASPAASYVNGHILTVDGGVSTSF